MKSLYVKRKHGKNVRTSVLPHCYQVSHFEDNVTTRSIYNENCRLISVLGVFHSSWLQENIPYYYSKTCEHTEPYLRLFWEKLYELGVYIAEITTPVRQWLNKKLPQLLEWACFLFFFFLHLKCLDIILFRYVKDKNVTGTYLYGSCSIILW